MRKHGEKACKWARVCVKQDSVSRILLLTMLLSAVSTAAEKPSELTLRNLDGKKVRLSDYRGKVVVLNFWATWCGPCQEEMPMMVEEEKKWEAKGVTFIAVSLDDSKTRQNIPAFLDRYHVSFPVWTGASSDELDKLHLGQGAPDTAFLDENGVIVARVLGEIRREELEERLTWLSGDRKGEPPPALVNHM
jgi:thiol-disulfide isomerase/thioredoxin